MVRLCLTLTSDNAVMQRKHTAQLNSFETHFLPIYLCIVDSVEKAGKFTSCAVGKGTWRDSPMFSVVDRWPATPKRARIAH